MDNLIIKPQEGHLEIPAVYLDYESGVCEISGESYPDDPKAFFNPIIEWIKAFTFEEKNELTLNLSLYYFNTSSSKYLFELFYMLKDYREQGGIAEVNWYIEEWNADLKDEVEEYKSMIDLPINIMITEEKPEWSYAKKYFKR